MFNALCENGKAQAANFPFCTIEPNVGIVAVPDPRLEVLSKISNSQKTVPTSVEFVDIAGLVKGASKGEGLGNQFLANIRECDSIVQVVRCFEDGDVVHVAGKVDPVEDAGNGRLERLKKTKGKSGDEAKKNEIEAAALQRIMAALEQGKPARSVELNEEEAELGGARAVPELDRQAMVYAANVAEDDLAEPDANTHVQALKKKAAEEGSGVVGRLAQEEAEEFLAALGVEEGGLKSLIRGEKETRAWTVREGSTAPQAAGVIHTGEGPSLGGAGTFEKGFILAETVAYDDYVAAGGFGTAKEKGLLRLEGKDYVVKEGDIMLFRFNV
ncbi:hypothetical protein ABPG77_006093 [Micractinium sp. CCAP 211/92]